MTNPQGNSYIDPTEELDLSSEGLQRTRALFTVVNTVVKPAKSGKGRVVTVEFAANEPIDDNPKFTASDYYTVEHEKLSVAKSGRGKLKRLFTAAFGRPEGSIAGLKGSIVSAEVWEDDEGFRRIGRYQAPEAEQNASEEAATAPAASISL